MKTSFLLFVKQNVLASPTFHQTSFFAITVFITPQTMLFYAKYCINFVVLFSNLILFPHVNITCLVVTVWTFKNRNIIRNDVTPFYVQWYFYVKNEMWNKGVCLTSLKLMSLQRKHIAEVINVRWWKDLIVSSLKLGRIWQFWYSCFDNLYIIHWLS